MNKLRLLPIFENLYKKYNHADYIDPDPLGFVRACTKPNQELWAFIAAMFSLGRVGAILNLLMRLKALTGEDFSQLEHASVRHELSSIVYRFYSGADIVGLIDGVFYLKKQYGSLFAAGETWSENRSGAPRPLQMVAGLRSALLTRAPHIAQHLLPDPWGTGAGKRYAMFLRWMVRHDEVDLGLWGGFLNKRDLSMPVDTHVLRNAQILGLTNRKTADVRTVAEITDFFAFLSPEDPIKYDFVLSRIGIHPELKQINLKDLVAMIEH